MLGDLSVVFPVRDSGNTPALLFSQTSEAAAHERPPSGRRTRPSSPRRPAPGAPWSPAATRAARPASTLFAMKWRGRSGLYCPLGPKEPPIGAPFAFTNRAVSREKPRKLTVRFEASPRLCEAVPIPTPPDDVRHELPANLTHRVVSADCSAAARMVAPTFGPRLGESGEARIGGLDDTSAGPNWRRQLATASCRAPGRQTAATTGSAWTTRSSTTQQPTRVRCHARCRRPCSRGPRSHTSPRAGAWVTPRGSSLSRKGPVCSPRLRTGSDRLKEVRLAPRR
jgi:hypothetical protein